MKREDYLLELYTCIRAGCGFCRAECPAYEQVAWESFHARGRNKIALAFEEGLIPVGEDVLETIYACTTCGACEQEAVCGPRVKNTKVTEFLRTNVVRSGHAIRRHREIVSEVDMKKNPYGEPHSERFAWLSGPNTRFDEAEVLFFAGCTSSYRLKKLAQATTDILDKLSVKFAVLGSGEWCCGSPLIRTGFREVAKHLAEHNVRAIQQTGIKKVVTSCAGCYKTLKLDYEEDFELDLKFDVCHVSEFLREKMDKSFLLKEKRMTVTYHDPCHLGRGAGVYDAPREVIGMIPGVRLVEMERIKDSSRCCGAGGGVKSALPELSIAMAKSRLKDAKNIDVRTLVSSCPFCELNLEQAALASGIDISILDVVELIKDRME